MTQTFVETATCIVNGKACSFIEVETDFVHYFIAFVLVNGDLLFAFSFCKTLLKCGVDLYMRIYNGFIE